jgi:STE24 endopeptidase
MNAFSILFLSLLLAGTAIQLWLARRQARHVELHVAAVPAPFADRVDLEAHRRAAAYTLERLQVERTELVLGAAVLVLWTLGGGVAVLDTLWRASGLSALWQGVGLLLSVVVITGLLTLPLQLWRVFGIEARFGFNRTTPRQFIRDLLTSSLLLVAIATPLAAAVLWLMAAAGSLWWLYAWLVWMGFTLALTWAYPTLIAPLFNRFEPLRDAALRTRLERLLARCGFRSEGMFVMDGSRRSSHGNAYFTGFGRSKRIVFFDTLLDGLADSEVEAVLAHELGHYKRRHIAKRLALSAVLSLVGLALLGWLAGQAWFYEGLGVSRQSPALALTLFLLAAPVFTVFFSPLGAALSRRHEFEADDFAAAEVSAEALISGLVKMYRDNASTLTPDPWYSAFHHSHPPAPVRIRHLQDRAAGTLTEQPST